MDWKKAQAALFVKGLYRGAIDNDPGPATWGALLGYAAGTPGAAVCLLRGKALARRPEFSSPERVAHFIAETCHESGGYRKLREGMSYSSAARIRETWPSRFPTLASAQPYVKQPVKLANFVYARPKEGNTEPGDGWKYRGGGDIQTTFKNGFRRASADVGVDLVAEPERITDPGLSILTALGFYKRNGIWSYIDAGQFTAARAKVNTGSAATPPHRIIGLKEVSDLRVRLLKLFE